MTILINTISAKHKQITYLAIIPTSDFLFFCQVDDFNDSLEDPVLFFTKKFGRRIDNLMIMFHPMHNIILLPTFSILLA